MVGPTPVGVNWFKLWGRPIERESVYFERFDIQLVGSIVESHILHQRCVTDALKGSEFLTLDFHIIYTFTDHLIYDLVNGSQCCRLNHPC